MGLAAAVPLGWVRFEIRHGWKAGRTPADEPPFAPELVGLPPLPGEPPGFPAKVGTPDGAVGSPG